VRILRQILHVFKFIHFFDQMGISDLRIVLKFLLSNVCINPEVYIFTSGCTFMTYS